ncbi:MAG: UDP-N-acetylmuramoylalanine--D-glutamate ligase [Alteromonas naphthalenivorans]|jgi:UDP-N-acetylmuramoylalanine--D-glutamate ligase
MEYTFKGKKVGIWGFGKTGQSILSFMNAQGAECLILDNNPLDPFQEELIKSHNARFVGPELLAQFIELNDFIIPSQGVDIKPLLDHPDADKFISELDLFSEFIKTPVIAITGSAGKTTTTTLLTQLLNLFSKRAIAAGNIGKPMLDVLADQNKYDYIVLEVSSTQLEHAKNFTPTIATILNIFPNHLDRHVDMQAYIEAKGNLLKNQTEDQIVFLPMDSMEILWNVVSKQKVTWVGSETYMDITKELSDITCPPNWQIILSILEYLDFDPETVLNYKDKLTVPEHRVEFVGTVNGADFYNDSKATIPAATLQAVSQFVDTTIILFLGGLSKGIDRSELITQLPQNIKHVICFGAEAEQLHAWCQESVLPSSVHATLEDGFDMALKKLEPKDIVLFSPSGSSFDLFKNYEERGKKFKNLINQ